MPEESRVSTPTQITLDAAQIQAIIPHRPPFLLIDRIVELEPGKRIVGQKDVSLTADEFLRGHFPDYPVMPGVLIVEALAQTGAVLVMQDPTNAGMLPFFVLMAVVYGALHAALDTTAGERERGSLEPLLATPAPRSALVAGNQLHDNTRYGVNAEGGGVLVSRNAVFSQAA